MHTLYSIQLDDADDVNKACRYRSNTPPQLPSGYVEVDEDTWYTAQAGAHKNADGSFTYPPASE